MGVAWPGPDEPSRSGPDPGASDPGREAPARRPGRRGSSFERRLGTPPVLKKDLALRFILREFEKIVCAVLLAAMTALGFVNIVVRYASDLSFAASEEVLTNGFLLLTVFGAAIAARRGEHLAVTLLAEALPAAPRKVVLGLSLFLSVLLLALTAWFSWELVRNQLGSGVSSYALQVPMWYYSAALPFGFLLVLARTVEHAVKGGPSETPHV